MRHRLDAGSKFTGRGLFIRSARPVEFRITARAAVLVMIAALVLPTYFIAASNNTMARRGTDRHPIVPISAPPEVYGLAAPSSHSTGIIGMTTSAVAGVSEFFTAPPAPAGIDIPREPSPAERTLNKATNALNSLVAAKAKVSSEPIAAPMASPTPAGPVHFDFDGDAKADIGRWRSNSTEFRVKKSGGGSDIAVTIGSSSAKPAPGDYDNAPDGKTDVALFNAGTWTVRSSATGSTSSFTWGAAGDIPVAGDYDGDGTTDAAVYRPSTNTWWVLRSSDGGYDSTSYGSSGDIPVLGNFDTDAKSDKAVYRPSTGYWYVTLSGGGSIGIQWGIASDIPVPADYNNDGKTDMAVFRGTTGVWYVYYTGGGGAYTSQTWGNYGDQPAPADYDGDGKADYCVWRPTSGEWWISKSSDSSSINPALGVPGDFAVSSAYIKQIGGPVTGYDMATARLSPKNATGGTNLYSQNFAWGTSLVSLPGRAGMDAGLGIGYNSLVWIKSGGAMYFDPDTSNVAPGFRMGFPTIEPIYYDTDKSKWAYLMVTPSGGRVEFRQTAASGVYETADSSYTQLVRGDSGDPNGPVEDISMTVKTTDGTQMSYEWNSGAYRCVKVTDRNGNYITAAYNSYGQLTSITDTLARVINVNYTEGYPATITQTWRGDNGLGSTTTHTYASLSYTTKPVDTDWHDTNISAAYGPPEDTAVKVLDKVTYADGSSTKFEYNGYLQVKKISNIAADSSSHILNAVETNLSAPPSDAEDCPRLSETGTTVENFNGGSPVVVKNTLTTGQTFSPPDLSPISATRIQVWVEGHPDNLRSNTFVAASGWKEGLPVGTEDCITTSADCTTRKRWTWSEWTQDNTGVSYIVNPRVTENRVGDGTNVKKSQTEYWADSGVAIYGLVKESRLYDTDLSTVLKKSVTEYNLSSTYTNRRIIGLPSKVEVYGREASGLNLMSKVTYAYDEGDFSSSSLVQNISPTQHDNTNFSSSFVAGRGNLTSATRWNVEYPTTSGYAVSSSTKYNTAGSPVSQITPWDGTSTREVKIAYADNFNSSGNPSTYAYPTTLTDPNNQSSTVKYRYDIGANIEANSPAPAGQTYGKTSKRWIDSLGRLEKEAVLVNGAEQYYTRREFPTNGVQSKTYSTIVDTNISTNPGPDSADEVYAESWSDGAGRMRMSRTEHPGSTGGWTASQVEYDLLGRVKRQSVPTEVSVSGSTWTPSGDDATRGWLWTYQKYDWKGRVVRKINTDGTDSSTLNDSDVLISYEGCGCAGGQVTTIESERVPYGTSSYARRKKKVYEDILGRTSKTESFEWDGTTVYSTNTATYNGRDQVVLARQYAGTTSSEVFQDTTATFDGFGRLATSHKPEQRDNSNNLKFTTYSYNLDDSIQSMTDGRGVVTNYTYNSRGLVSTVAWNVGSTGVTDPTDVTFAYDNLGNRTQMTDGMGQVDYEYDALSRMIAETRDFTDTLVDSPISGGKFKLEYTYDLAGLKSYKDPYGKSIEYTNDKIGRVSTVTGTSFGGVTSYLSNTQFRAWGAMKYAQYGDDNQSATSYDNRLRPAIHLTNSISQPTVYKTFDKSYEYYSDGRLKLSDESVTYMGKFDRLFKYDHQGRILEAKTGTEAHGTTQTDLSQLPYRQSYTHDAFGNLTGRDSTLWDYTGGDWDFEYTVSNNRTSDASYDNDGRQIFGDGTDFYYDGAGRLEHTDRHPYEMAFSRTGEGSELKRSQRTWDEEEEEWSPWKTTYMINSSVLGRTISETTETGKKKNTYVLYGASAVARQSLSESSVEGVAWQYSDAVGTSSRGFDTRESDALGNNIGIAPVLIPRQTSNSDSHYSSNVHEQFDSGECSLDGIYIPCSMAYRQLDSGAAIPTAFAKLQHAKGFNIESNRNGNIRITLPDIFQNNYGTWAQAPGTNGEGRLIFAGGVFNFFIGKDIGTDANKAARKGYSDFLAANSECAKVAKELGLDKEMKTAKFLSLLTDEELKTHVKDLGFKSSDLLPDTHASNFEALTAGDLASDFSALANPRTDRIYLLEGAYTGAYIEKRVLEPKEFDSATFGATIFHELAHLVFGNSGHVGIADKLGLTFDKSDPKKADDEADKAFEEFIKAGCAPSLRKKA